MSSPHHPVRRGASREVRLRRTIVGGVVLVTVTSSLVAFARDRTPAAAAGSPAHATASAPRPASVSATPRTLPSPIPASPSARSSTTPTHRATPSKAAPTDAPDRGDGSFSTVHVPGKASTAKGTAVTYRLKIEGGMRADKKAIARTVRSVLLDPRGWQSVDHVRFVQATGRQQAKITIMVASPKTTDRLCYPAKTESRWSCFNQGNAVLNYRRWLKAVPQFKGNVTGYRQYLVNHEVGHGLGHTHRTCPAKGDPAPVMQEQSMGLHGCTAWFWPMSPKQAAKAKAKA